MKFTKQSIQFEHQTKPVHRLVENCHTYKSDNSQLSVYETFKPTESVPLLFPNPVLIGMVQGKKVMSLAEKKDFDFLPGQSILLAANTSMCIDFPQASPENPARCLVLAISSEMIQDTLDFLNETHPKLLQNDSWKTNDRTFFHLHDRFFDMTLHRVVQLFLENHEAQNVLIDLSLKEIVVRLLKTEGRNILLKNSKQLQDSCPLALAVEYIKSNLSKDINIADLCKVSGLSQANLFRHFKNELEITPIEYLNRCRIEQAKKLLQSPCKSIKDACYETGFNSVSYFTKVFKKAVGFTPKQYKVGFN